MSVLFERCGIEIHRYLKGKLLNVLLLVLGAFFLVDLFKCPRKGRRLHATTGQRMGLSCYVEMLSLPGHSFLHDVLLVVHEFLCAWTHH